MSKDFVYGSMIWGAVATIIICTLIGWCITMTNNDHEFDVACVNKGKQLVYEAVPGESYAKKECK